LTMRSSRFNNILDYFPIAAYLGFWLQGGLAGAVITGEARLMALAIVTLPAMAAMTAAVIKIRNRNQARR